MTAYRITHSKMRCQIVYYLFLLLISAYAIDEHCPPYNPVETRTFKAIADISKADVSFDKKSAKYTGSSVNFSFAYVSFIRANTFVSNTSGLISGIDLRNKSITNVTEGAFASLKCLSFLDLSENRIRSFKSSVFEDLVNLKFLNISCNNLTSIPTRTFFFLKSLKVLDISFNSIAQLTSHFEETNGIEHLNISDNLLKSIDFSLDSLQHLKDLDLSKNRIAIVHMSTFSKNLELERLNLSSNQMILFFIKETDGNFTRLKILDLSYTFLQLKNFTCGLVSKFSNTKTVVDLNLSDLYCEEWRQYEDIFNKYHVKISPGKNFSAGSHHNGYACNASPCPYRLAEETGEVTKCIEQAIGHNGCVFGLTTPTYADVTTVNTKPTYDDLRTVNTKPTYALTYVALVLTVLILIVMIMFAVDYFVGWNIRRRLGVVFRNCLNRLHRKDDLTLSYAELSLNLET